MVYSRKYCKSEEISPAYQLYFHDVFSHRLIQKIYWYQILFRFVEHSMEDEDYDLVRASCSMHCSMFKQHTERCSYSLPARLLFELYYYMINDIWTYDMMSALTHIGCCRSIKWDSWSRYFQMLYLRRHIPDVESEAVQLRSITESSWKRYHPLIFDSIRDAHSQWRIPVIQCQIIWDLSLRGSLQIAA